MDIKRVTQESVFPESDKMLKPEPNKSPCVAQKVGIKSLCPNLSDSTLIDALKEQCRKESSRNPH